MKGKKEKYEKPHIVSYEVEKGAYSAASGVTKESYHSLFWACCDQEPAPAGSPTCWN